MANSKVTDIAAIRKKKADQQRKYRLVGGDELRKKSSDYARKYYRNGKGFVLDGATFICEGCSVEFKKIDVKQKRCDSCRVTYGREQSRQRRLKVGHVPIGTKFSCKNCAIEIEKKFKRHFYCQECTRLSEACMLPHQIDATRARLAKFMRERRRNDPKWNIASRMSAGISSSLRDGKNGRHWETLVGYTIMDLMFHLERQFLPGMAWENRGRWHVDHRRPLASFKFSSPDDPDFKAAWALTNLQPLWARDNILKSAKITYLI